MSRRRIILYTGLFLLAVGLLGWQWWAERREDGLVEDRRTRNIRNTHRDMVDHRSPPPLRR